MAEDGLPTIVDVGVTHSLADTYFSQNTSVGVRGYAANRYAKSKDTDYKKVIRDNNLQLHSRSAVMETYGAFSKDLWSLHGGRLPAAPQAWRAHINLLRATTSSSPSAA